MTASNKCCVPGCLVASLPAHIAMCRAHWVRVPYPLRSEVRRTWIRFQGGRCGPEQLRAVYERAAALALTPTVPPAERLYRGERLTDERGRFVGVRVTADGQPFSPDASRRVFDHSPTGFEWGYGGSGPSQLALALVLDATGDVARAQRTYHWFKWSSVACWGESWSITAGRIREWVAQCERESPPDDEADVVAHIATAEGGAA